jgi:hypothetical protein
MGMRMCPLSMTAVPQVFSPNYTLRQTIARYNQDEDFDEGDLDQGVMDLPYATLAICKPKIRKAAQPGDLVIGVLGQDLAKRRNRAAGSVSFFGVGVLLI